MMRLLNISLVVAVVAIPVIIAKSERLGGKAFNNMNLYTDVIMHLKYYEGFRDSVYDCASGHPTYGFGIRADLHDVPDTITYLTSTKEVQKIFTKHYERVQQEYPGFYRNQYLAFALLSYRIGFNSFKKSTVLKKALEGKDPKSTWLKWKYYTHPITKEKIKNKRMEERCRFEYELYSGNVAYILKDEKKFDYVDFLSKV